MLYGLQFVPDHPVYRLDEVFGHFLNEGLKVDTFSSNCFPKWFEPVLSASPGLRRHCKAVHDKSRGHDQAILDSIIAVWKSQGNVQGLCENEKTKLELWGFAGCQDLIDALNRLFNFLYDETLESKSFEKAAGKSLLDPYSRFRGLDQRVCPFCGLNYYADRGGGTRNSYDHFLPRVYYPLAAVNFRNLVPMCDECNERPRKGTKDVLFRDEERTTRRRFYYPYSKPSGVALSVKCSKRPKPNSSGTWKVEIRAVKPSERTLVLGWNSVFGVETRFSARVKEGIEGWMGDFLNSKAYSAVPSVAELKRHLAAKAAWLSQPKQIRTRAEAALQSAAFSYMANDAPDDMLAGYAAMATSSAVVGIPTALGRN
jgi:hypothetical protein